MNTWLCIAQITALMNSLYLLTITVLHISLAGDSPCSFPFMMVDSSFAQWLFSCFGQFSQ